MSPGAGNSDDLAETLERIKAQNKGNLSKIHLDLLNWHKNVDKRYAWVVLIALFFMMTATLGPYRIYGLIYAKVTEDGIYTREEASWPVSTIYTVENVIGPFVSIIVYHISYSKSMFIGGLLLALGNGLTALSDSLWCDVLLLGLVQGIGYSFIFMPFMEIINNYFLKYRNIGLGIALCGGTLSIFWWQPLFQWILVAFPWRYSYLGLGLVCSINILMVPLLKPNPMPQLDLLSKHPIENQKENQRKLSRVSFRALSYRNSVRQQSVIMINKPAIGSSGVVNSGSLRDPNIKKCTQRQASVISVNPFASSAGLERKISRAIANSDFMPPGSELYQVQLEQQQQENHKKLGKQASITSLTLPSESNDIDSFSLNEVKNDGSDFKMSIIWDVLKTPGFHLIWYSELLYFWVFSIYCLVMVDYGTDRGCTTDEAQSLLNYQSIGELFGRLVLTIFVDMRFLSNKNVVILVLLILAGLLVLVTHVTGFVLMAFVTVTVSAFSSLLYILLNGLLVDFLGESQVTIGYGMASCIGGILMSFRPQAVGYFRDTHGTYDPLMICLAISCAVGAVGWLIEPLVTRCTGKSKNAIEESNS